MNIGCKSASRPACGSTSPVLLPFQPCFQTFSSSLALAHRRLSSPMLLTPCFPLYRLSCSSLIPIYGSVGVSDRNACAYGVHKLRRNSSFFPYFLGASTVQVESRYNGAIRAFDPQYKPAFYFSSPRVNPSFPLSSLTPLSPRDHFNYVTRLSRP